MNVFLQVTKDVQVTRGKIWAVRRMLKCFEPNLSSLSLTRLAVWGWALSCKRIIPSDSIPGHFDFTACRSTLSHHGMFFFAYLHFQCWTNTLYTMLSSSAIKKQLCGPVSFHYRYARLLSYKWQYRYLTTVLPAFVRNVFYGRCYKYYLRFYS